MGSPKPYDIVVSLAGHDAGQVFMVVASEGTRLSVCNGKNRSLNNPKSKSPKHVRLVSRGDTPPETDKGIRKTLASAAQSADLKEGTNLVQR